MKILLTMCLLVSSTVSIACSCALQTAESMLRDADLVFLGIAKSDSQAFQRSIDDDWLGGTAMSTPFEVIADYKNTGFGEVNVISPVDYGANCGIEFKKQDGVVLVTASKNPVTNEMVTSSCSVTWLNTPATYNLLMELEALNSLEE